MSDALSNGLPAGRIAGRAVGRSIDMPAGRIDRGERDTARGRTPARQKSTPLVRERHQADYAILVIVVALTAVGILMAGAGALLGRRQMRKRRAADTIEHPTPVS